MQSLKFRTITTGHWYPIRQRLSSSSRNVTYLASCNKRNSQHVDSTSTEFKVKFGKQKLFMIQNRKTSEFLIAVHFSCSGHAISQICFAVIKQITKLKS